MITLAKWKLLLLGLGAGVAGFLLGYGPRTVAVADEELEPAGKASERAERLRQRALATDQAVRVELVEVEKLQRVVEQVGVLEDPRAIIEALAEVNLDGGVYPAQRRVIHLFQSLRDQGTAAVEPMGEFLRRDVDRKYFLPEATHRENLHGLSPQSYLVKPLDPGDVRSLCPRTLRLGVIDLLGELGGRQEVAILVETLQATASGIELATIEEHLQAIAPGKHIQMALENARELLRELPHILPQIDKPSRFDELSRNFLLGLLLKHRDRTHLALARQHLITEDHRLDTLSLSYIHALEGENCIPLLRELYQDKKLPPTNRGVARDVAYRNYLNLNRDITIDFAGQLSAYCTLYHCEPKDSYRRAKLGKSLDYLFNILPHPTSGQDWTLPRLRERASLAMQLGKQAENPYLKERLNTVTLNLVKEIVRQKNMKKLMDSLNNSKTMPAPK